MKSVEMNYKSVECYLCSNIVPLQDGVETVNEDAEIVYICKECAENEEREE